MKPYELNEIIPQISGLEFNDLVVTMDSGENADFSDGRIYYNARGNYYWIRARRYSHYSNTGHVLGAEQGDITVTLYARRVADITYS